MEDIKFKKVCFLLNEAIHVSEELSRKAAIPRPHPFSLCLCSASPDKPPVNGEDVYSSARYNWISGAR